MVLNAMRSWIFLRGLSRESGHWGAFLDAFRLRCPHDAVNPIDLAGNGELYAGTSPATIGDMITQLRRQVDRKQLPLPAHLVGISMGGMVASQWAADWPQEVKSAVLINTSMRPYGKFYQRLRPHSYPSLVSLLWPRTSLMRREEVILALTSATKPRHVLAEWVGLQEAHPVSGLNAIRQLVAAGRYRAPTNPPAAPTLVLTSQQDQLVDDECSLALSKHWNTELRIHPWAGHDLPLDDAQWVIDQILHWGATQEPEG